MLSNTIIRTPKQETTFGRPVFKRPKFIQMWSQCQDSGGMEWHYPSVHMYVIIHMVSVHLTTVNTNTSMYNISILLFNLDLDYVHYVRIASLFNCDLNFHLTVHIIFQNVANTCYSQMYKNQLI